MFAQLMKPGAACRRRWQASQTNEHTTVSSTLERDLSKANSSIGGLERPGVRRWR
jgi:hypothetical protein